MRPPVTLLLLAFAVAKPAFGETTLFAALRQSSRELVIYSTLDSRLAAPLIAAFQAGHQDVSVRYEDLLAGEIAARIIAETDAGGPTADFTFSSAMDV